MNTPNDSDDVTFLWKIPGPNWQEWNRKHKAKLWQAVALLCNLDPKRLENRNGTRDTLFVHPPEEFSNYLDQATAAIKAGLLKPSKRNPRNLEESEIDLTLFSSWANISELPFPNGFPWQPQINLDNTNWPWGRYETESLRKLAKAADRFWKNYDPADPSTAPTNLEVEEWLIREKVTPRIAKAIATILRADGLATGRRRK